jgi:hypothetical protein
VDPVRDGSNCFAYVNNDPMNWIDPWGLDAIIVYNPKTKEVNIEIPITYIGGGAKPENIEKFNDAIEKEWTGQFGEYSVKTIVTTPDDTSGVKNTFNVGIGNSTAYVAGVGSNFGVLYSGNSGWVAAHKAGHLLGIEG